MEGIIKFSPARSRKGVGGAWGEVKKKEKTARKMLPKMLSKDANAAMNYSVMTTRSVREGREGGGEPPL